MSFTDKKLSAVYKDILHTDNSNTGISTSIKQIKCGDGDATALYLSSQNAKIQPASDSTTNTVIYDTDGNALVTVDSTNDLVKAGIGQHIVNTQYAVFSNSITLTQSNTAGYHYPLQFGGGTTGGTASLSDQKNHFGNGTDPATSFTTADATDQRASDLISYMWYVPDAMSIDAVYSIEGADAATGDTTRFHLMGYTFTSGSTSCLTSGALLAHNSDTTNAGSEQVYLSSWTIDSAAVTAGKVIICTFESDSINSDHVYAVTVKYHLT